MIIGGSTSLFFEGDREGITLQFPFIEEITKENEGAVSLPFRTGGGIASANVGTLRRAGARRSIRSFARSRMIGRRLSKALI
jgi:hypothetical protein